MTTRTTRLLLLCAVVSLAACQDTGTDSTDCNGGTCDDVADVDQVMPRAPEAPGTISITRSRDKWLFEVIGDHGDIVLLSEEYESRTSALNGVLSTEDNGVLAERYTVADNGNGFSYQLEAGNGEVLADSQSFATEAEALAAVSATRDLVAGIVQYKAALTRGAQFVLSRNGSKWEFTLLTEGGSPLLKSQLYSRRRDAITGVESVRKNGKDAARYTVLDSPLRFILKAGNGEEIAESSETFDSVEAAEAATGSTRSLLASERVANPW